MSLSIINSIIKKTTLFLVLLIFSFSGYSQARWVLNNNAFLNIGGNVNLVIDNNNGNAITQTGSGGRIVSENERNVIKWNVGSSTGNYIIPFTNKDNVKIPVEINITSAGDINGNLILSTYRTDNTNSSWPTVNPAVTNMCSDLHPTDASQFVVDRFWRIDANSYTTKPAITMSLGYDFANEAGGSNTISGEASLQAQRFNPTIGTPEETSCHGTNVIGNWESLTFGMPNVSANKVSNIVVSPNNLFKDWILVDNSKPLPVNLINFDSECKGGLSVINWSTASETNNDYFRIEKSLDGFNFSPIATVQGSGSSNALNNYSYRDNTPNIAVVYYRLKQVDFDGKQEYFDIISSNCTLENNFIIDQEFFGDNSLQFNIFTTIKEALTVSLYDYNGKQIISKNVTVSEGNNQITLSNLKLEKGIYILNIIGEVNHYTVKLFKQ